MKESINFVELFFQEEHSKGTPGAIRKHFKDTPRALERWRH